MVSDRSKIVRGVLAFLAGCAVLGLALGLKGSFPRNVDPDEQGPMANTPSGVVIEDATAQQDTPPVALVENKAEPETSTEEVKPTAPPAEAPKPAPPPVAAPKEEPPPADPVGDLIQQPAPAPPPPTDLY